VRLELAGRVRRPRDQRGTRAAGVLPHAEADHQGLRRRAEGMTIEAYALRADGQVEPQGIIAAPVFSWRLRSDRVGARQAAYRIVVELRLPTGGKATVWDSGRVETDATVGVRYRGAPLASSADYRWTLDVEDELGSVRTAASAFATGVVHRDEWDAVWIGRNPVFRQVALPPQDTDISFTVNKLQPA